MATQLLLPFVLSPDAHAQPFILNNSVNVPGAAFCSTPCVSYSEKTAFLPGGDVARSCIFCEQMFAHQDELGPHILTQHPTTFVEPGVLRVDAEFRMPGAPSEETCRSLVKHEEEDIHRCIVCGLVAQNAAELESHMRKHKDYYGFRCEFCGRCFKQAWFLKNHIKMHTKVGGKGKSQQYHPESSATINGVIQDPQSEPGTSAYIMCKVCGFIFPDHDSLVEHSQIHNRERDADMEKGFFQGLNLQPKVSTNVLPMRTSKWIPQLNPITTYQAWQVATKAKVAVRHNATKEPDLDVSTDQESSASDKDDLHCNASEGHGDKLEKKQLGRERQAQPQSVAPPPPERRRRSLIQKDNERPTTCEDCQRTFRTYHQLVLHSRVHKKEKNGVEAPPPSLDAKQARTSSPEQPEDGAEEGSDDAMIAGEDDSYQSKRSKECSYCGKSFKSSYYLTIHLRTHTGEKPYKCVHCDYAAAQKTSLKYHVERRHKDLTSLQSRSGPPSSSSPPMEDRHMDKVPASNRTKLWLPAQGRSHSHSQSRVLVKTEGEEFPSATASPSLSSPLSASAVPTLYPFPVLSPAPVSLLTKQEDVKMEDVEEPLNLSLKVSFPNAASAEPAAPLVPMACPVCPFKSMYPEVIITHKQLVHKIKLDCNRRSSVEVTRKRKRSTECPPALHGNDVTALLYTHYPRRTKSPCSQKGKAQEKAAVDPPKQTPERVALPDVVQERVDPQPSHEASRYREATRKTNTGNQYVMERVGMVPRGGPVWHCLPTHFGPLPHMYSVPSGRESETSDQPGFRPALADGSKRLVLTARSVKTPVRGPGLGTAAEALQSTCPPVGAAMERSDWTMNNFLHSVTPSDLAALYHSGQISSAPHGGLHPQRPAGSRTVLYQHLPTMPSMPTIPNMPTMPSMPSMLSMPSILGLQRRDPSASASYSNLR